MNREFEYLRESNRAKSFNEQMDEYLELERKELMNSIYNNPPKLVDREKLKIVRESDNQQRVEAKIPRAPKLFDYDSVRMVREDKPVTPTTTAPKSSYNYAQITPKRKNPFTPNSELWRHYDKILNSKQKVTEAKPINLKPDVKPAAKPKLENTYTPGTPLWEFYDTILNKKFQKPAAKPTAPTENITLTPPEPNKITEQTSTPNNKPTTPTVKIAEEASSVVTPTRSSPKGNVDLLRFGKFSQVEKPKEETDNIVTPTILNKELKVEKERNYDNKSINISVEDGALQSDEFSTNAHNYSQIELSNLTRDPRAKSQIMDSSYITRDVAEARYRKFLDFALSDDDNLYDRVTNAFLKGEGLTTIYDNEKKLNALVLDEHSITSKKLKNNPSFKKFWEDVYLERIKQSLLAAEIKGDKSDTTSFELNLTRGINSKKGKDSIVYSKALNFSKLASVYSYDYYPLLGGIQKIKADIQITKISDTKYNVKSKICILDWYGSDLEDIEIINKREYLELEKIKKELDNIGNINSLDKFYLYHKTKDKYKQTDSKAREGFYKVYLPGLEEFFMLQHRFGCKPFAIQIIYTDEQIIDTTDKNDVGVRNVNFPF